MFVDTPFSAKPKQNKLSASQILMQVFANSRWASQIFSGTKEARPLRHRDLQKDRREGHLTKVAEKKALNSKTICLKKMLLGGRRMMPAYVVNLHSLLVSFFSSSLFLVQVSFLLKFKCNSNLFLFLDYLISSSLEHAHRISFENIHFLWMDHRDHLQQMHSCPVGHCSHSLLVFSSPRRLSPSTEGPKDHQVILKILNSSLTFCIIFFTMIYKNKVYFEVNLK